MIEAGHRCAIPTCRAVASLQIEHIEDWAKVRRHDFENMIVLCANCHGRKGNRNGQIDRKALRQYKANLAVINSRYSDLERRVLEHLAEQRAQLRPAFENKPGVAADWARGLSVAVPGAMRLLMGYLIRDCYVELVPGGRPLLVPEAPDGWDSIVTENVPTGVLPSIDYYRLTHLGLEFLDAWIGAQPIEDVQMKHSRGDQVDVEIARHREARVTRESESPRRRRLNRRPTTSCPARRPACPRCSMTARRATARTLRSTRCRVR